MAFRVIWTPKAEEELTRLWLNARDRHRIREAADQVDRLLQQLADAIGESRDVNQRVLFLGPLGCLVEVDTLRKYVEVKSLWRIR